MFSLERPKSRMRGGGIVFFAPVGAAGSARSASDAGLYQNLKRSIDVVLATLALLALAPLLVAIAGLVYAADRQGVLFRQVRVGRDGQRFVCYKFRTMVADGDALLQRYLAADSEALQEWTAKRKLRRDPRVTRVGRFLRRWSLDELPQLLNVIRGEMSLVGPRPAMENELILYGAALDKYLAVRPGLTGPWQVAGRANLTFSERVQLESQYPGTMCFATDLAIMVKTVGVLVRGDGAC